MTAKLPYNPFIKTVVSTTDDGLQVHTSLHPPLLRARPGTVPRALDTAATACPFPSGRPSADGYMHDEAAWAYNPSAGATASSHCGGTDYPHPVRFGYDPMAMDGNANDYTLCSQAANTTLYDQCELFQTVSVPYLLYLKNQLAMSADTIRQQHEQGERRDYALGQLVGAAQATCDLYAQQDSNGEHDGSVQNLAQAVKWTQTEWNASALQSSPSPKMSSNCS